MFNVLVSNGTASLSVLEEIAPYIDAMNIDLKGFSEDYYNGFLGGNSEMTLEFIRRAVTFCHVELTTLVVPGKNDSEEEMAEIAEWISDLKDAKGNKTGEAVPLHLLRCYPRFKMQDIEPTDLRVIQRLAEVARKKLKYVYAPC
jgi:pyruvate formate lyase activating enzyme